MIVQVLTIVGSAQSFQKVTQLFYNTMNYAIDILDLSRMTFSAHLFEHYPSNTVKSKT